MANDVHEFEPTPPVEGLVLVPTIDHLLMIDPLDLTSDDLLLIVQHYRANRINFIKLDQKPKTVEKSRGPKLDPEATKKEAHKILAMLMGEEPDDS